MAVLAAVMRVSGVPMSIGLRNGEEMGTAEDR
jgi:hypothetical protein